MRTSPRHIILKLSKVRDKNCHREERILKAARETKFTSYKVTNFPEAISRLLSSYLIVQERVGLRRYSFPGKQNLKEFITPRLASPEILSGIL